MRCMHGAGACMHGFVDACRGVAIETKDAAVRDLGINTLGGVRGEGVAHFELVRYRMMICSEGGMQFGYGVFLEFRGYYL